MNRILTLSLAVSGLLLAARSPAAESLSWAGGNGVWDVNNSANNTIWKDTNGANAYYVDPDLVNFDNATGFGGTVTLNTTVSPGSVTVSNTTAYTISGSGGIAGTASLSKAGTGMLTLATANTFSGGLNFSGTTLTAASAGALGSGPVTGTSAAVLTFNTPSDATFTNVISLASPNFVAIFNASASATITLNGNLTVASSYCGITGTGVGNGGFVLGGSNYFYQRFIIKDTSVTLANTYAANAPGFQRVSLGDAGGSGSAVYLADGTTMQWKILDSANNDVNNCAFYVGMKSAGSSTYSGTGSSGVAVDLHSKSTGGSGTAWNFEAGAGATCTFSGAIINTGSNVQTPITKTGAGTVVFSGVNTYGGDTTVANGSLQVVTGGSSSNSAVTVAATSGNTATLGVAVSANVLQWTCASLTVNNAGVSSGLDFDFGSLAPSTNLAPLRVLGAAAFTTPPVVSVNLNVSIATNTPYPLMTWGSTSGTAPTNVTMPSGYAAHLTVANNTLYLVCDSTSNTNTYVPQQFTVDSTGTPTSLVLGGVSRLSTTSANGFYLNYFNGINVSSTKLVNASSSGNTFAVWAAGGLPKFTFRVDSYGKHFSLHLTQVEGIGTNRNWGLQLSLKGTVALGYKDMDDMVTVSGTTTLTMNWNYLWATPWLSDGGLGSVAIWDGSLTGSSLDAALAEVWVMETLMPRPAGQASWTTNDVLAWVSQYQAKFHGLTVAGLAAGSLSELYSLTTNLVIPIGAKRINLQCATWRPEYWPNYNSLVHVNTSVFPAGLPDLLAYANFLHAHGIQLQLHSVSLGIGLNDPDHIVGHVDRRLASWGAGTLAAAVNATTTTLLFRPAAGTVFPLIGAAHAGGVEYFNYLRVDDEIVKIGSFNQTEEGVWSLQGCTRGLGGTVAAAHSSGADSAGLYCPYGKNYVPADDLDQGTNSLGDELAKEYADFVNTLQLDHLHFDGPEIHDINPWTRRELLSRVYNYTDHLVTSSQVGSSIDANFEQKFSAISGDASIVGYWPLDIGIRTVTGSYLATSWLDINFLVEDSLLLGARWVSFDFEYSGLGINQAALDSFGLSSNAIALFQDWKLLATNLAPADINYLAANSSKTPGSNHYQSEDVQVLQKVGTNYVFVPYHVMGQTNGLDAPWKIQQEKGAVARKQAITTGDTLVLSNPEAAQALTFVIRNSHASQTLTNPRIEINGGTGYLQATGTLAPGQYLQYTGGTTANVCDQNWKLVSTVPVTTSAFTVPVGTVSVTTTGSSGSPTLETQFIVLGTPYVLVSNNNL